MADPKKEEQLIQYFESVTPEQLLHDLSGGDGASEQDLNVIKESVTSQDLPMPVMNVLIHYVLLQSNMKLPKIYLKKMAAYWSRKQIQTAREAMQFARQEKERAMRRKNANTRQQNDNLLQQIQTAIAEGYTDEQLGYYVRNIVKGQV